MLPRHVSALCGAALLLTLLSTSHAYFVYIDAHAEECFYEKVVSGTKLSLIFEVAEGGFLDIDVKVWVILPIEPLLNVYLTL